MGNTDALGNYISCGTTGMISVTYDDGPSAYINTLLTNLKSQNVLTTFFFIGSNIVGNEAPVKLAYTNGHDIASHTWTHPDLTTLTDAQIQSELKQTSDKIFAVIGRRPKLFRPPYGSIDARVFNIVKQMGYASVLWNLDTNDWAHPNSPDLSYKAYTDALGSVQSTQNSFISLQHDFVKSTVDLAVQVQTYVKSKGYTQTKISTCIGQPAYA